MDKKMVDILNQQINKELYSAYLYLGISNYFYNMGLDGYGNYFKVQTQEEQAHAELIKDYLLYNDAKIELFAIEAPTNKFDSITKTLDMVLAHEKYITKSIYDIYKLASNSDDFATKQYFDWFVKEQMEEEKSASDMITKYKMFGSDTKGLMMLDKDYALKVFTAPAKLI